MTYRHRFTGLLMHLDWENETEVGLRGGGFTWCGTREAFERMFEVSPAAATKDSISAERELAESHDILADIERENLHLEQQLAAARSEVSRLKPQLENESEQAAERDHAAAHWFQQYREASANRKRAGEILLPQLTARLADAERERPAGFSYTGIALHITKAEARELAALLGDIR